MEYGYDKMVGRSLSFLLSVDFKKSVHPRSAWIQYEQCKDSHKNEDFSAERDLQCACIQDQKPQIKQSCAWVWPRGWDWV